MFKFFRNLFKKQKPFSKEKIEERMKKLSQQKGVEVKKHDDNTFSIAIDGSISDLTPMDILRLIEGK
jgi:hypothetical protein